MVRHDWGSRVLVVGGEVRFTLLLLLVWMDFNDVGVGLRGCQRCLLGSAICQPVSWSVS